MLPIGDIYARMILLPIDNKRLQNIGDAMPENFLANPASTPVLAMPVAVAEPQ
ncbi:hypothetical protein [Lusitaniella coriacea]|uniref:hypothetical protein n=1 Tax=Lusitaniella coriacea TaxID=1983105 RepID=UPI001D141AA4|nr:hypothetical protein [Lusitaniella coriacea]